MDKYPPLTELRSAIDRAGYRFDRFAGMVGLSPTYLNHQLAGRKRPSPDLFRRAADVLHCHESDLTPRAEDRDEDLVAA